MIRPDDRLAWEKAEEVKTQSWHERSITPVPIPNTMVKARAADGTTLVTVWESRWPPDSKKELWKGRAETALMHLENCIRRKKYSLILKKKTMSKIESNRNETIKTSEVMLTNMTRPERVAGRRPG